MPSHRSDHPSTTNRPSAVLLALTCALVALLALNLVLFDDLRVDPTAGALETFTKPPHLSSLVAGLLAVGLVALGRPSAARVAAVVAWLQIAGFTLLHLVPAEVGPVKPYWGEGMGDLLQWVGLVSILAVCAAIVRVTRRGRVPAPGVVPA